MKIIFSLFEDSKVKHDEELDKVININKDSSIKIGRSHSTNANNGQFRSQNVSKNHAEIYLNDGKLFMKDLGSLHGSFIISSDGKVIEKLQPHIPQQIYAGTCIQLAKNLFRNDKIFSPIKFTIDIVDDGNEIYDNNNDGNVTYNNDNSFETKTLSNVFDANFSDDLDSSDDNEGYANRLEAVYAHQHPRHILRHQYEQEISNINDSIENIGNTRAEGIDQMRDLIDCKKSTIAQRLESLKKDKDFITNLHNEKSTFERKEEDDSGYDKIDEKVNEVADLSSEDDPDPFELIRYLNTKIVNQEKQLTRFSEQLDNIENKKDYLKLFKRDMLVMKRRRMNYRRRFNIIIQNKKYKYVKEYKHNNRHMKHKGSPTKAKTRSKTSRKIIALSVITGGIIGGISTFSYLLNL